MHKLLIFLTSIAVLTSCSGKKKMVYENDTDGHEWMNLHTITVVPNPHSGSSVSRIDSTHSYSLGFAKTIELISNSKFKEVQFSYWAWVKNDQTKATTVLSIDFNGQNINWQGRPLKTAQFQKWIQITETFKLPKEAQPNNQLSLYVWNNSKEEILVDDLKIVFK